MVNRRAVTEAAARELANAARWDEAMTGCLEVDNYKAAKQFRLDANAARMRATRLLDSLRTGKQLPRDLRDAVKACQS